MPQKKWRRIYWISFVTLVLGLCPSSVKANDSETNMRAAAHYLMGHILDLQGDVEAAAEEYKAALVFDSESSLIHLRLGMDYARLNLLGEAKKELNLAAKYNPEDLQSHYYLAIIYTAERDYALAAMEYEYILQHFSQAEPWNVEIYGYLGQLYYSQKKYPEAIKQFEKVLEYEPQNADVLYVLGSLYVENDQTKKAIEVLSKSIEIDPQHDGSLNTLGYIYADNNEKLDEAENLIERALRISPDNGAYLDSLGWVHYQKGNYQEALRVFKQADAVLKDPAIYEHLGDVYFKLNQVERAVEHWEFSLELKPGQNKIVEKINGAKNAQASTR